MQPTTIERPRGRMQDEPMSALAYWSSGFAGIAVMLAMCFLAGLRF